MPDQDNIDANNNLVIFHTHIVNFSQFFALFSNIVILRLIIDSEAFKEIYKMATILRRGSRGRTVRRLQNQLNSTLRLSPQLSVDGDFGSKTEAAVRQFQSLANLKVDGVVGARTWAALEPGTSSVVDIPQPVRITSADTPWMSIARSEIGQREVRGSQHNARIVQYHSTTTLRAQSDEVAWCASFVNWCLLQAGFSGTNSAGAASWTRWGQRVNARNGAITVIHNPAAANTRLSRSGNHVGFLVQNTATHYILLGGNQSDSVKLSSFPKSRWQLKGFRWPNR